MNSNEHFVRIRGKILGPFSIGQLIALRERGQIQPFHEVSLDRYTWEPASTLTQVFQSGVFPAADREQDVPPRAKQEPASRPNSPPPPALAPTPPPLAQQDPWFLADDMGNRQGPIDPTTFKIMLDAGQITKDSMLWRPGMTNWVQAEVALPAHFAPEPETRLDQQPIGTKTQEKKQDSLGKTRLGILLMLIGGAVGLLCLPVSPVAFTLALIGTAFCMAAPNPARGPAQLTFYFGLTTLLLCAVWFIASIFGWDLLVEFVGATYSGDLFRKGNQGLAAVAAGASLTFLGFLGITFLFAVGMLFTCGAFLQHLLKKLAEVAEDTAILKLASFNFTVYCVISVLFVTLIYLWVLMPLLFLGGFKIFSPLVLPKIVSFLLVLEAFLLFCVAICYIITLVVLIQLFGKYNSNMLQLQD